MRTVWARESIAGASAALWSEASGQWRKFARAAGKDKYGSDERRWLGFMTTLRLRCLRVSLHALLLTAKD